MPQPHYWFVERTRILLRHIIIIILGLFAKVKTVVQAEYTVAVTVLEYYTPCPEKKEPIVFYAQLHQILTDFQFFSLLQYPGNLQ